MGGEYPEGPDRPAGNTGSLDRPDPADHQALAALGRWGSGRVLESGRRDGGNGP